MSRLAELPNVVAVQQRREASSAITASKTAPTRIATTGGALAELAADYALDAYLR